MWPTAQREGGEAMSTVTYPTQCSCGHIFLEKFSFKEPRPDGAVGFCWCGFCSKKLMVYPYPRKEEKT
jgi:hypothetical protein